MRFFVDKLVPKGYKPLTYLESSKTQYIDTGFIPNQDTRVVSVHEYIKDPIYDGYVFGAGYTATDRAFEFYTWAENWNSPYGNTNIIMLKPSSTLVINNKITIDKNKNVITIKYFDGSTQTNSTTYTDFVVTDRSMWLFAINRGSTGEMYKSDGVRLYSCKIWNKDILVRDFQPALRESDNKPGMYDRVNNVFYTNAGTGEFLYEEPVDESVEYITNPNYQQVEYLEGTGTQYIDTGYAPIPATTKFDFVFSPDTIAGNSFIFGCRPDSGIGGFTCTTYFATGSVRQDWAGLSTYFPVTAVGTKYRYTAYNNTINLNEDSVTGTGTRSTTRLSQNFLLFTVNTNGTADTRRFVGKIYYSKLWDNGILVRNFIPAIRKSDNKPGMYDKVTGQFFTNAGTDEFLYGSLVGPLPPKYKELEYIESTGTQWIDTLFTCTSTDNYTISEDVQWTSWDNTFSATYNSVEGETGVTQQLFFGPRGKDTTNKFYYGIEQGGVTYIESTYTGLNERHTYELIRRNGNSIIKKDGIELYNAEKIGPTVNNYRLFGCILNEGNTGYAVNFMRNYGTKIIKNGIFIHDFVPCYKVSNGEAGLYDRVTGAFFANGGTGSFVKGEKGTTLRNEIIRLVRSISNPAKTINGYRRIDYLQCTGTQYIDTEYNPNSNTKVEAKFKMNETPSSFKWLFLARSENAAGSGFGFGCINNGYISSEYNNRASSSTDKLTTDNIYVIVKDKNVCNYNDKVLTNTQSTFTVNYSLPIFALNNIGSIQSGTLPSANCYYFRIYDNDVLVRDFYPVLDENDTPCMYDTVTKKLYKNKGTGTFGYGEVLPSNGTRIIRDLSDYSKEYKLLKYLESTGTQYINTGIDYFADFEVGIQLRQSVANKVLGNAAFYCMQRYNTTNPYWQFTNGSSSAAYNTQTPITEHHVMKWKDNKIYADGVLLTELIKDLNAPNRMYLYSADGTNRYPNMIYFCKLWDPTTGELVRNFIPMLRKADNKSGLYDTVNKVFYTNAGTDEFLYETA